MDKLNIMINGRKLTVSTGATVLEAASLNNIYIPTLCAYEGLSPKAACKLCAVSVKGESGEKLACTTKVAEGMEIVTDSQELFAKRRKVVEEMFRQHTVDCRHCLRIGSTKAADFDPKFCESCFFCDCVRDGFCELQDKAEEFQIDTLSFEIHEHDFGVDSSTGSIIRNMDKCIKCRRCVDVCKNSQGVGVIGTVKTENGQTVGIIGAASLAQSDCIRCGHCVDVCPTGALYVAEHKDEIVYTAHSYSTQTAAMLSDSVLSELQVLYKEKFSLEQVTGALKKLGIDHVYSTGYAKAISYRQGLELLNAMLGKKTVILTDSYVAKNFLRRNYPQYEENFAFYDSVQKCFGDYMRKHYPDIKLINVSRGNGNAAEAHETACVDFFVNPRELYRILLRTGGAPVNRLPCALEELDEYEKREKYAEILCTADWRINGEPEIRSFTAKGKLYTAAICHNLSQAKKAIADMEKYDVIKVIG